MMSNSARTVVLMALFGVSTSIITPSAQAASEDECAVWLCLPSGFPSGCGSAKSAMLKRVKKGKSPLPDFLSCAVKGNSGGSSMTYDYNNAAAIQERRVCKQYSGNQNNNRCIKWETIPAHYIKGETCRFYPQGGRRPEGCTATYKYVDVFIDGKNAGDTYFWR